MAQAKYKTLFDEIYEIPAVKELISNYSFKGNLTKNQAKQQLASELQNPHAISYKTFKEKFAHIPDFQTVIRAFMKEQNVSKEKATYLCYYTVFDRLSARILKKAAE